MQLLICVLNETEKLTEFLAGLAELGVSGGTIIESQGMPTVLATKTPVSLAFRHLLSGEQPYNYTFMSVVEGGELLQLVLAAIRAGELPGTGPGSKGIAFHLPVTIMTSLGPQASSRAGLLQKPMLDALEQLPPSEVEWLVKLGDRLVASQPLSPDERRGLPRLACRFALEMSEAQARESVSLLEFGLDGLTLMAAKFRPPGWPVSLEAPAELADCKPTPCLVKSCHSKNGSYLLSLTFAPEVEALRESWSARLLSAFGYHESHLPKRRRHLAWPGSAHLAELSQPARQAVEVLDLGMGGAWLSCEASIEATREVVLRLDEELDYPGVLVDAGPGRVLMRFHPLGPAAHAALGQHLIALAGGA